MIAVTICDFILWELGEKKGMIGAISDLCEVLGIPLTGDRRAQLLGLDLAALDALRQRIKAERAWPS